jgi:hypothetical protein
MVSEPESELKFCILEDDMKTTEENISPSLARGSGLTKFCLRWIPHTLGAVQMQEWVMFPHQIPQVSKWTEEHSFRNVVTGDESWSFLSLEVSVTYGWFQSTDELPSRLKQII